MIGEILLTLVAIVGLILQYRAQHKPDNALVKQRSGIYITAFAIVGLIGANFFKYEDSKKLASEIDSIRHEFRPLESSHDSLLVSNQILKGMLETAHNSLAALREETGKGFDRNLKKLDAIGRASGVRMIPEESKSRMISILSGTKGSLHFRLPMGDQEAMQYAEQLKAVFRSAGWCVTRGYDRFILKSPFQGLRIMIKEPVNLPAGLTEPVLATNILGESKSGERTTVYKFSEQVGKDKKAEFVYINVGQY